MDAPRESPEVQSFLDIYHPDTPVVVEVRDKRTPMTLGEAIAKEAMYCVAPDTLRQDPEGRLTYFKGILEGAGSLIVSDQQNLNSTEEQ